MDEKISKTRMDLVIRNLERRAGKIDGVPYFRGVPVTDFESKEHLVMLCTVFAEEWRKAQAQYYELLEPLLPADRLKAVIHHLQTALEPSIWRRIWNKLKPKASSTPDSAHAETKTNARA